MLQIRGAVQKGAQMSLDIGVCVVGLEFAENVVEVDDCCKVQTDQW